MLDDKDESGGSDNSWSEIADEWTSLWGPYGEPIRERLIEVTGIGPGTRVLDIGCGAGELLRLLERVGADPAGVDPARRMVELAGPRARLGDFEHLPYADASFDVVTAINSLQFTDDALDALAEAARVTAPGGLIALAVWAEGALNDLGVIEGAVSAAAGEDPLPDGELRPAGGLERILADAGLEVVASGAVDMPWIVPDQATLVRSVLLGEDDDVMAAYLPVVLEAAERFREGVGYRLMNVYRYAVGRVT